MGKSGQDIYTMTLKLGKEALAKYSKGASIIECLPSEETMDWVSVDIENKTVELRLT